MIVADDFVGGGITDGTFGSLGWNLTGSVSYAGSLVNNLHPGAAVLTSSGSVVGISLTSLAMNFGQFSGWDMYWVLSSDFIYVGGPTTVARVGLVSAVSTNPQSISFLADSGWDSTYWQFEAKTATRTVTQAGYPTMGPTRVHTLRIRCTSVGTIRYSIDGGTEVTISSGIPTGALFPCATIFGSTSKTIRVDYFGFSIPRQ